MVLDARPGQGEGGRGRDVPAWPVLLGAQLLVLMAVLAAGWWANRGAPGGPDDVDQALRTLDVPAALTELDAAVGEASRAGALLPAEEAQERTFLSLLARGAGLEATEIAVSSQAVDGAPTRVRVEVGLVGDVFGLPAFLDGVHRQRATVRVEAMDASIRPGGQATIAVALQFRRPAAVATDWIGQQLSDEHPGAEEAAPVLERAADLAAARQLVASDAEERAAAKGVRDRIARELPAALVRLRDGGGTVRWTATDGLEAREASR